MALRAFAAVAVVLALIVSGCGNPATDTGVELRPNAKAQPCTPPATWSKQATHEVHGAIALDPPPSGAQPKYSSVDAFAHTTKDTPCGTGQAEIRLTLFSDREYGHLQADDSVQNPYQNVLAWAMIWRNQACLVLGPGPIPVPDPKATESSLEIASPVVKPSGLQCDQMTFIDANSNKELLTVQIGVQ